MVPQLVRAWTLACTAIRICKDWSGGNFSSLFFCTTKRYQNLYMGLFYAIYDYRLLLWTYYFAARFRNLFSMRSGGCHHDVSIGYQFRWLLPIAGLAIIAFSILVYFDPVRIRRVTSFLDVEANAGDVLTNYGRECLLLE